MINLMAVVWWFFTAVFAIYALLLFGNSNKVLTESFKRNKNHPYFDTWRLFAGAGYLTIAAGCALWAMGEVQETLQGVWALRGLGALMWIIGLVIVFIFNKRAILMFQPAFYKEHDEIMKRKREARENKKRMKEEKKIKKNKDSLEG